ncbi:MAG: glycosyltransferase family 4 protein [Firmicutes bacterium]|nr:glycosyltransferase family 4 protein [Bacillota bacterium]
MNILLINHYAGSPDMGMEFRPYYFAREWIKMGHKVDIIAADYSHLRRKNPVVSKDFQIEEIGGITYHWIKTNEYEGNGAKRALTMAKFVSKLWLNSKRIVDELEPDAVICSSTYPLDTYVGQRIRRISKKKVKLIHEAHDLWPATLIELGGMSKYHPFVMVMQMGENSAYRNSDFVISLAEYTEPHMRKHGLKQGKYKCIPIGLDLDEWRSTLPLSQKHSETISNLKEEGKFIIGYFGGHAMSNALNFLIDAAAVITKKNKQIHFVLVGSGIEKKALEERVKHECLDNITFLPPINKKEIPNLLGLFDCIYIGTYKNSLYRFGMCLNKMADSMMAGVPMICSISSPPTWAEKSGSAITVESENVEEIVDAIYDIFSLSSNERFVMGEKGRLYAENSFDISKLALEVIDIIDMI